ncbi:MAG: carboxypeptidase-like regulatory domain-containing protein [Bacteroidales bacterium]|nr:carboxypeptidase-like regulatory domain-containing protein [Bacteroidales bacterium]
MKIKSFFRAFMLIVAMVSMVLLNASCEKTPEGGSAGGTVSGVVKDSMGNPVEGVTVTAKNVEGSALTDSEGRYELKNVPAASVIVTFTKPGYQTANVTVPASRFDADGNATANATLNFANAKIKGVVLDGTNNNAPFANATVRLNNAEETTATTDADGKYLIENLTIANYTVTVSAEGFIESSVSVSEDMFNNDDKVAVVEDVVLTKTQLLPGLTLNELQKADKWFYNEYRGGGNGEQYPRWDWSTCFMGSLNFYGDWSEHGEGTCIEISGDASKPADPNRLESYVWGSKMITADNKIMTVRARTFGGRDGETVFGVVAVDLNAAEPNAVTVGTTYKTASESYEDYHFDLSDFVGKEVVLALGIYRAEQSDQGKHLAIRRINFTHEEMHDWDWIKGTDVAGLEGWHMTEEIVRSTMPQTAKEFSGLTLSGDSNQDRYQSWRTNSHIGYSWCFTVVSKDTEPFAGQGFVMKTRGGNSYVVDTKTPEAYFYTKLPVAAGSNELTFKIRNFGDNFTVFKVTAITEDCQVEHLAPKSNTAVECIEAGDGCWKFKNNQGEPTESEVGKYADFVYDLSKYNGKNVIVTIGVFKGEENGDENKICFHSITLK